MWANPPSKCTKQHEQRPLENKYDIVKDLRTEVPWPSPVCAPCSGREKWGVDRRETVCRGDLNSHHSDRRLQLDILKATDELTTRKQQNLILFLKGHTDCCWEEVGLKDWGLAGEFQ